MTSHLTNIARSLDIWDKLKKYVNINQDWSINEVTIHLSFTTEESFVDVYYFDLGKYIPREEMLSEENDVKRFKLSLEDITKMYSDINDMMDMPLGIHTLHVHLKEGEVPYFDVKFIPTLKNKEK